MDPTIKEVLGVSGGGGLFVGNHSHPSFEEKGEGFENGKKLIWLMASLQPRRPPITNKT
jgi:hypothetical protein